MTGENLSGREGIKVTRDHEVAVDWTRAGYSEEDLNHVGSDGLTEREHMDKLTTQFLNAQSEEERNKIIINEEASKEGKELSGEFLSDLASCGSDIERRILGALAKTPESSLSTRNAMVIADMVRKDIAKGEDRTPPQVYPPLAGGPPPRQDEEEEGLLHSPRPPHSPTLHSPTFPHPPKTPFG